VTITAVLPKALTIGSQNLTITYSGDSNYSPATLAATLSVTRAPVNVAVSSPMIANPVYGQPVVLTATFTGATGILSCGTVGFDLKGAGTVNVQVTVGSQPSNTVTVAFK
jgi:hypothetical protein